MGKHHKKGKCCGKCEHCDCGHSHNNPNITEQEAEMLGIINLIMTHGKGQREKRQEKDKTLYQAMLEDADL